MTEVARRTEGALGAMSLSPGTTTASPKTFYLSLEILRGLCAFEVFAWHCAARISDAYLAQHPWTANVAGALLRGSDIAVIVFFVISGFVTTISFRAYYATESATRATLLFYGARALRIWSITIPITLILVLCVWAYRVKSNDWQSYGYFDLKADLIRDSALGLSSNWNAAQWTLVYEMVFYTVLPFFCLSRFGRDRLTQALAVAALIGLSAFYLFRFFSPGSATSLLLLFVAGMVLAWVRENLSIQRLFRAPGFRLVAMAIAVAGLASSSYPWVQDRPFSPDKYAFAILLVAIVMFNEPSFARRRNARVTRVLAGLGACSYSLYLTHWPILTLGTAGLFGSTHLNSGREILLLGAAALPAIALATWLSWWVIERHARMKNLLILFGHRRAPALGTPSAVRLLHPELGRQDATAKRGIPPAGD